MNNKNRISKYIAVWDSITTWIEYRLSQKEELSTSEVKHLAEIQEKIQKSCELLVVHETEKTKSSLDMLIDAINKGRKMYYGNR